MTWPEATLLRLLAAAGIFLVAVVYLRGWRGLPRPPPAPLPDHPPNPPPSPAPPLFLGGPALLGTRLPSPPGSPGPTTLPCLLNPQRPPRHH